jgi:hypothetical protein
MNGTIQWAGSLVYCLASVERMEPGDKQPPVPSGILVSGLSCPPRWGRFFGLLRDARPEGGNLTAGAFDFL